MEALDLKHVLQVLKTSFDDQLTLDDIYLLKNKPLINVAFSSKEAAENVYKAWHHKNVSEFGDRRLHLVYTTPKPQPLAFPLRDVAEFQDIDLPEGLIFENNFLSAEEQQGILTELDVGDQKNWVKGVRMARRVQHYGYKFNYDYQKVDHNNPTEIPKWLSELGSKLKLFVEKKRGHKLVGEFDQITANEYLPGQGIRPHVDSHASFHEPICSISLVSPIVMDWRYKKNDVKKPIVLNPGSVVCLFGDSRFLWTHGISARKIDKYNGGTQFRKRRISLTFRISKKKNFCDCQESKNEEYKGQCDFGYVEDLSLKSLKPTKLEQEHVHDLYNHIADHFSATRYQAWEWVKKYIKTMKPGSLIIDVGSGNGKYLEIMKDPQKGLFGLGCDRSEKLIEISRKRGHNVCVADGLLLPYRSGVADYALSVAVLHHLSTEFHRYRLIEELVRITCVGGEIALSAWAKDQDKTVGVSAHKFDSSDNMVKWTLLHQYAKHKIHKGEDLGHGQPNYEKGTVDFMRYCHTFEKGEIDKIFEQFSCIKIIDSFSSKGNHVVIARKISEK